MNNNNPLPFYLYSKPQMEATPHPSPLYNFIWLSISTKNGVFFVLHISCTNQDTLAKPFQTMAEAINIIHFLHILR